MRQQQLQQLQSLLQQQQLRILLAHKKVQQQL